MNRTASITETVIEALSNIRDLFLYISKPCWIFFRICKDYEESKGHKICNQ